MASSATGNFNIAITGDNEGGADYISFTWSTMTPVINNTQTYDLVVGSNVLNLNPFVVSSLSPQMVVIVPPPTNTETLVLIGSGLRIHKTEPSVLRLDTTGGAVTSVSITATGTVTGLRLIVL